MPPFYLITMCLLTSESEQQEASSDVQSLPKSSSKVNPYSVIDITPLEPQHHEQQDCSSSPPEPVEPEEQVGESPDNRSSPAGGITSGYSIPVPCGYATPSGVPLITPAYTTPVIIRHLSADEDGKNQFKAFYLFCSHFFL